MKKLEGKVALITGASRGIGNAIAKRFILEGVKTIIAVSRSIKGIEELDDFAKRYNSKVIIVPMDLKEHNKIDQLGFEIFKKFGYIDILVGNAGILNNLAPVGHITPKEWDEIISVNLTANYRLIRSFDTLIRKSNSGRVIFLTNNLHEKDLAYYGAYSASKAGLESLVKIYASENLKTNIKINLVSPEGINTYLREKIMPGENQELLKKPQDITDIFVELASDECKDSGKIFIP